VLGVGGVGIGIENVAPHRTLLPAESIPLLEMAEGFVVATGGVVRASEGEVQAHGQRPAIGSFVGRAPHRRDLRSVGVEVADVGELKQRARRIGIQLQRPTRGGGFVHAAEDAETSSQTDLDPVGLGHFVGEAPEALQSPLGRPGFRQRVAVDDVKGPVLGIERHCLFHALDGTAGETGLAVERRQHQLNGDIVRLGFGQGVKVERPQVGTSLPVASQREIDLGVGVGGVRSDGAFERGDGLVLAVQREQRLAQVVVSGRDIGPQLDSPLQDLDGLGRLGEGDEGRAEVGENQAIVRLGVCGAAQIPLGLGVVPADQRAAAKEVVGTGMIGIDRQHGAADVRRLGEAPGGEVLAGERQGLVRGQLDPTSTVRFERRR